MVEELDVKDNLLDELNLKSGEGINSTTNSTALDYPSVIPPNNSIAASVSVFESQIIIPLYVIIFVLSILGNCLVIVTLTRNKRMRTVTNVYLLNLAVSDLLLGVFCMPFTLVGQVLRNFIFGAAMCKMIPYIQAVSVSVGVWTLVAISLERYFAICRPLKSRRWQTQFHAYKMIALVWAASLFWNGPILAVSSLQEMRKKKGHKCREEWPSAAAEQAYNLFLDGMLLLVPLIIMSLAYSLIVSKLWKGLRREIQHNSCQRHMERSFSSGAVNGSLTGVAINNNGDVGDSCLLSPRPPRNGKPINETSNGKLENGSGIWLFKGVVQVSLSGSSATGKTGSARAALVTPQRTAACGCYKSRGGRDAGAMYAFARHAVRSNHMDKSIEAKKKVIRMLFVIIAEFFICWAPLHVLNTVYLFSPDLLYDYVGSTGVSLVQLLAYVSSCCNPITYCFMNKKFRQAFLGVFGCYRCTGCCCGELDLRRGGSVGRGSVGARRRRDDSPAVRPPASDASLNDSTAYLARASTLGRSEVIMLEAEDRV